MGYITPQTVIVGRLLTLSFILILRLSQVCTSKDISDYCSLEHWRHSASKRYSYSDIVDSFVKYVSNLQHLAAERQTRSAGTTPLPSKKRKIKYSDQSPDHHQAVLSKAVADTIYNCSGFCVFIPGNPNRCISCNKTTARYRCVGCNS